MCWKVLPADKDGDPNDSFRLEIVDDQTMKLTRSGGEAQDGSIIRIRCAAE